MGRKLWPVVVLLAAVGCEEDMRAPPPPTPDAAIMDARLPDASVPDSRISGDASMPVGDATCADLPEPEPGVEQPTEHMSSPFIGGHPPEGEYDFLFETNYPGGVTEETPLEYGFSLRVSYDVYPHRLILDFREKGPGIDRTYSFLVLGADDSIRAPFTAVYRFCDTEADPDLGVIHTDTGYGFAYEPVFGSFPPDVLIWYDQSQAGTQRLIWFARAAD